MLAEWMATAKHGTWEAIGKPMKELLKLYLTNINSTNQGLHDEYTEFETLTDGGYFVRGLRAALVLVAPDSMAGFYNSLADMSVLNATAALRDYTEDTPLAGWDRFTQWFDGVYSTYGAFISSISICGKQASSIPRYSNPNHTATEWFAWLYNCGLQANGLNTVYMRSYRPWAQKYSLPLELHAGSYIISEKLELLI